MQHPLTLRPPSQDAMPATATFEGVTMNVIVSQKAMRGLEEIYETPVSKLRNLLSQHARLEHGDVSPAMLSRNTFNIRHRSGIVCSVCEIPGDSNLFIWTITQADWSQITVLTSEEYDIAESWNEQSTAPYTKAPLKEPALV